MNKLSPFLFTLRPKHWIKNLFIFSPAFFALRIGDMQIAFLHVAAFLLFSLLAGAVYTINDVVDLSQDRFNKSRKKRPVTSGAIHPRTAMVYGFTLALFSIAGGYFIHALVAIIMAIYFGMNLMYSAWLKKIVIIDVFIIAFGFILRLLIGAVLIWTPPSHWIILATFLVAIFLGFGKRRGEIEHLEAGVGSGRAVLNQYSIEFIDRINGLVAGLVILSYIFYTISEYTVQKFHSEHLIYTSVFVIYGFIRYFYLIHIEHKGENPTDIFYTDVPTIINFLLWVAAFSGVVYFQI